jgi:hypothetical protein
VGYSFAPLTHRVDGFPVLRLLCPIRLLMEALEFRWAFAYLLPTLLIILHEVSRVRRVGLKQNDLGGVFLPALTALCGSLILVLGMSGLPVLPSAALCGWAALALTPFFSTVSGSMS